MQEKENFLKQTAEAQTCSKMFNFIFAVDRVQFLLNPHDSYVKKIFCQQDFLIGKRWIVLVLYRSVLVSV